MPRAPLTDADRRYALGLTVAAAIAPVFVLPFARGTALSWLPALLFVVVLTAMPAAILQAAQSRLALVAGSLAVVAWVTFCWIVVLTSGDPQAGLAFVTIPMLGIPFAL